MIVIYERKEVKSMKDFLKFTKVELILFFIICSQAFIALANYEQIYKMWGKVIQ